MGEGERSAGTGLGYVYGKEAGCDVVFLVGQDEPTRWRLPAHSAVLRRTNVVFSKMFSEPYFPGGGEASSPTLERDGVTGAYTIHVTDVDARSFDNLLLCLYREPVSVQNVETALLTLYAGHKYQCPDLVTLCVAYLIDHRKETNVLGILKDVRVYVGDYQSSSGENDNVSGAQGTATMKEAADNGGNAVGSKSSSSLSLETIEASCSDLLQSCLTFIDSHAVTLLQSDDFEDLDLPSISLILSRDGLDVPDELKVFQALLRWADKECKRKHLPLTNKSKRDCLEMSLFLPRYLTMTPATFAAGPAASGIFAEEEILIIKSLLDGKVGTESVLLTTPALRPYLLKSGRPRTPIPPLPPPQSRPPLRSSRKRLSSISFFFRSFRLPNKQCCCKSKTLHSSESESSTPSSSSESSPTHHAPPPPAPSAPPRESHQPPRANVVEQVVVCFACLLD